MGQFGKTHNERMIYGYKAKAFGRLPVVNLSDMGDTRVIAYKPSEIKGRLREVSDALREHRDTDLTAERDALLLQAEAAGWTASEMRAACRCENTTIHQRLKKLHARIQSTG